MSSTEPPSRMPPRGQSHESKAAREEISSKGKVEKVREVDADETRKRKFQQYLDEDQSSDSDLEGRPSIFDLNAQKPIEATEGVESTSKGSSKTDLGNAESGMVPSPSYSPPPNVDSSFDMGDEESDDEATAGALPQSDDFWEDVDFPPEQPSPPTSFQETPRSAARNEGETTSFATPPSASKASKQTTGKKGTSPTPTSPTDQSPFGPPGKPSAKGAAPSEGIPHKKGAAIPGQKPTDAKKLPSPFDEAAKTTPKSRALDKDDSRYLGESTPTKPVKKTAAEKSQEEALLSQGQAAMPLRSEDREGGKGGQKNRDQKVGGIDLSNLPSFPSSIQPAAVAATQQAVSYLSPSTISLFFQMVGTMYVMTNTSGISRTQIILNNPSYANSKFFGSTITVEKYATAPDSFNIRLTGTDEAVNTFRDNVPSLMAAFQNGNFNFRVNRLDVEYSSIEKPVFRRREKGDERGEAGGGDLGERRK